MKFIIIGLIIYVVKRFVREFKEGMDRKNYYENESPLRTSEGVFENELTEEECVQMLDLIEREEKMKEESEAVRKFKESIATARRLGVPEDKILKTIDEVDDYFMN